MVARELEDVGVHEEDEHIAAETELKLEVASVGEGEAHILRLCAGVATEAYDEVFGGGAKEGEGVDGGVVDLLL